MKTFTQSIMLVLTSTLSIQLYAQENGNNELTAHYDGANTVIRLNTANSSEKGDVTIYVYRQEEHAKNEEMIFKFKKADTRASWVYTDTMNLEEGNYIYRIELFAKNKAFANESIIVHHFTPGTYPIISSFKTASKKDDPRISVSWKLNQANRVRNLILERKNSYSDQFETIAILQPKDSTFIDSVTLPNEAYFYRFQIQDIATGKMFQSATIHYIPTFECVPTAPLNFYGTYFQYHPKLTWTNNDVNTRGYYIFKLNPIYHSYEQTSLIITPDSSGNYQWIDSTTELTAGATYNYYLVGESHSYQRGASSDTVSIYIPANSVVLHPPQNLHILQGMDSTFRLIWDIDSSYLDKIAYFQVFRKGVNETEFQPTIEPVNYSLNYVTILNPKNGDSFYVISGNGDNKSIPSQQFTLNAPFQNDFGPKYLKAEIVDDQLWLKWNLPEDNPIKKFKIYKWDNLAFKEIKTLDSETDFVSIENYLPGENNTYYISAENEMGEESNPSKYLTVF